MLVRGWHCAELLTDELACPLFDGGNVGNVGIGGFNCSGFGDGAL